METKLTPEFNLAGFNRSRPGGCSLVHSGHRGTPISMFDRIGFDTSRFNVANIPVLMVGKRRVTDRFDNVRFDSSRFDAGTLTVTHQQHPRIPRFNTDVLGAKLL